MKKFALIAASLFAIATLASAQMGQDKSKRPSPPASAECKFSDGKTIKIDYSSPRAKGRKIFGEASDKAWFLTARSGARALMKRQSSLPMRM
jgi:opacity protein-like surface antigen